MCKIANLIAAFLICTSTYSAAEIHRESPLSPQIIEAKLHSAKLRVAQMVQYPTTPTPCNDPQALKVITDAEFGKQKELYMRLVPILLGQAESTRFNAAIKEVRGKVFDIRQQQYDSENKIRYCAGTYTLVLPSNPADQQYLQNVAAAVEPAIDRRERARWCAPGEINFKIQPILDQPSGFHVTWECTH